MTAISVTASLPQSPGMRWKDGAYSLGTRFFLDLYRTLGEEEFRRCFRDLYRLGSGIPDPEDTAARSIESSVRRVHLCTPGSRLRSNIGTSDGSVWVS